jgi:hypothetical protein
MSKKNGPEGAVVRSGDTLEGGVFVFALSNFVLLRPSCGVAYACCDE